MLQAVGAFTKHTVIFNTWTSLIWERSCDLSNGVRSFTEADCAESRTVVTEWFSATLAVVVIYMGRETLFAPLAGSHRVRLSWQSCHRIDDEHTSSTSSSPATRGWGLYRSIIDKTLEWLRGEAQWMGPLQLLSEMTAFVCSLHKAVCWMYRWQMAAFTYTTYSAQKLISKFKSL